MLTESNEPARPIDPSARIRAPRSTAMSESNSPCPLYRSLLFVPANNARALDKAQTLPADNIAIDLEDAVATEQKDSLRDALPDLIASRQFGYSSLWVRINAVDTPAGHADLRAVARLPVDGIILPKVENAEDVHRTGVLLGDAKRMITMVETPLGVINAAACCAAHPQVAAVMLGAQDLTAALTLPASNGDRSGLQYALQATLLAARAAGVAALDSVSADFRNLDALSAECDEALRFGYDGKAAIHPAQLDPIHATFSVSDAELAAARAVVACFDEATERGQSVAKLDGRMIEALHARRASAVIARAELERKVQ